MQETLESLVLDEADLILSYGHDDEIKAILGEAFLPRTYQTFLMSATLSDDVHTLQGMVLKNPVRTPPHGPSSLTHRRSCTSRMTHRSRSGSRSSSCAPRRRTSSCLCT